MDYFKQRRAYRNFKMYEASVSNGQNNLYRELLDYANDEGKLDEETLRKIGIRGDYRNGKSIN